MPALVTLEKTKTGLKVDGTDSDDLLVILIDVASDAVVNYLKDQASELIDFDRLADSPSDYQAPNTVQYATILQVGFYLDGGEDKPDPGNLCDAARNLLYPLRDPALA